MSFKAPINSALTDVQKQALSKLNSLRTYTTLPQNKFQNLSKEQQISSFDLSVKFLDSLVGPGTSEGVMTQFLNKIFATVGPDNFLLEDIIIKGLADTLDANNIKLAPQPKTATTENNLSATTSNVENAELTGETSNKSFSQFEVVEYSFISREENISGATLIVDISTNIPDRLPEFQKTYLLDENSDKNVILTDLKITANNEGFFENGIKSPVTGTKVDDVEILIGDLYGEVVDETGVTIPGAKVELLNSDSKLKIVVDINGKYEFKNIEAKNYDVKIYHDSDAYEEKIVKDVKVNYNTRNELKLQINYIGNTIYSTGDTQNNINNYNEIIYSYELIGQPVQYIFNEQNLPTNATSDFIGIRSNVENNIDLQPILFEEQIDNSNETYNEIINNYNSWKQDLIDNGKIISSASGNTRYPFVSPNYVFTIKNNANLPEYLKTVSVDSLLEAEELLTTNEFPSTRNIDGIEYPPQGSKFVINNLTDSSGNTTTSIEFLPNQIDVNLDSGTTVVGTISESGQTSGDTSFKFNESGEFDNVLSFGFNPEDVGLSNKEYLEKYLRPSLNVGKRILAAQIIKMIFGPKEIMSNNEQDAEVLLNSAACGEKMFSVTNNPSITESELEFNRVQLKKQLESGKIELTISCQKVEIKLPENFESEFDLISSEELGIPEENRPNPANSFILLQNYVTTEMQRQRNEEDANAVSKSFFQILIDKIMQYISVAFAYSPEIGQVFDFINTELDKTGQSPLNPKELLSSPCQITQACGSGNKEDFEKKSAFSRSIINSLYSLVLSMLIQKLIAEAKVQIRKLIQEKAKEKILKLLKRRKRQFESLQKIQNATNKIEQYREAFKNSGIKGVFEYVKKNKEK